MEEKGLTMNDAEQRTLADSEWSLSGIFSGNNKHKIVVSIIAVVLLVLGGLSLVNYPLETMIIALFIGSVFVLDRR